MIASLRGSRSVYNENSSRGFLALAIGEDHGSGSSESGRSHRDRSSRQTESSSALRRPESAIPRARATASTKTALEDYATKHYAVTVRLYNPTGGAASFYVGTAGATQEAAQDVEVNRAPELLDTLQPHQSDVIYVKDWPKKYIS
jgi:hypothetical protein